MVTSAIERRSLQVESLVPSGGVFILSRLLELLHPKGEPSGDPRNKSEERIHLLSVMGTGK